MTTLTCLSIDETKVFIETMAEEGRPTTTKHHHKVGKVEIWNFTLSNGDYFQLWERNRAFETVYSYYRQGIGSRQYKSLKGAVKSIRDFF